MASKDSISKARRKRSPNYPNYDLKECIGFITRLHIKYGFKEVYYDEAITQMGHSPTSSTANRVLSALAGFGLIEERNVQGSKFVQLTRLAQEILLETDIGSKNYFDLLKRAALKDSAMLDVWEKWGTNLPSLGAIEKSLILELGFSQVGAKKFASVIVETYSFANLYNVPKEEDGEVIVQEDRLSIDEEKENVKINLIREQVNSSGTNKYTDYPIPISGGSRHVVLRVPDQLTAKDFEYIIQWVNLLKMGLLQDDVE